MQREGKIVSLAQRDADNIIQALTHSPEMGSIMVEVPVHGSLITMHKCADGIHDEWLYEDGYTKKVQSV